MSLLSDLGLEFVNPTTINTGLKLLKPSEEAQIFSVILNIPGLENTTIKYSRHNFYNQMKRSVRCWGGSCCVKAQELNDWLAKLPEDDQRKRQRPLAQTRYILPVVLYQGKTAQAYGGPIEVRYIDIAAPTYIKWDQARAAVNEDIAPFYQRDFIMTQDSSIKGVPVMTHLESKAKWLTDPALNAEVMAIISKPDFIQDYVKVVPNKMSDSEFLTAWNAAMSKPVTAAEQAVNAATIQPAVAMPQVQTPQITIQTPMAQPMQIESVQPAVQEAPAQQVNVAPITSETIQQVNVTPAQQQIPLNTGLPFTPAQPAASTENADNSGVPFTPQNLINGSYTLPNPVSSVSPADIVNMQPVQLAPAEAVQAVQQPEPTPAAETPTTAQTEISLANVGDLDAIIGSLKAQQ